MNPYYQDEYVQIFHGDCREILPELPKVDHVLTSPPYDNLRDYGGHSFDFDVISRMLYEKTLDGGVVVWVVGDATVDGSETGTSFRQVLRFIEVGYKLHDTMIYHKYARFPDAVRYFQEFEYMFVLSKGTPKSINFIEDVGRSRRHSVKEVGTKRKKDGSLVNWSGFLKDTPFRKRGNVWSYGVATNGTNHQHPASFPESLAFDHISSWSNAGDLVLDPFLGSGTTAYCAKKLNRKCIGIEIEEKYCEIAAKRCSQGVFALNV